MCHVIYFSKVNKIINLSILFVYFFLEKDLSKNYNDCEFFLVAEYITKKKLIIEWCNYSKNRNNY